MKRRLQVFLSDLIPIVKDLMVEEVRKDFGEDYLLPPKSEDVTVLLKGKSVVFSDTLALFSVSRRSNNYRSRYRHHGQTSSIYLTDGVAKERGFTQIGSLIHTVALKKGPVLFTSIRDQKQETIEPLMNWLPSNTPHFSDDGFPYFHRLNFNYRCINHTARAKNDKRYVWAKNRWSKNGVHNQTAEGNQRAFKTSMRNYSWVNPVYSQLYASEYCGLKALRIYGIERIVQARKGEGLGNVVGK